MSSDGLSSEGSVIHYPPYYRKVVVPELTEVQDTVEENEVQNYVVWCDHKAPIVYEAHDEEEAVQIWINKHREIMNRSMIHVVAEALVWDFVAEFAALRRGSYDGDRD